MSQKDFVLWLQKAANHTKAMAEQWGNLEYLNNYKLIYD
jgi:hypothetical protein